MKKIAVCGFFPQRIENAAGQGIKTMIIFNELKKRYGCDEVYPIHTGKTKLEKFTLPFRILKGMIHCKCIVMLPAQNGVLGITPVILLWNIFLHRKTFYAVVGGWLADLLKDKPILSKQLMHFSGIFVETNSLKGKLENIGFSNIYLMRNCKNLNVIKYNDIKKVFNLPLRLCTFSRVMKQKGIEDAVNAVESANQKIGENVFELTIYGRVQAGEEEWFEALMKSSSEVVKYGGVIPFDESVAALRDSFVLLFPTLFKTEGIPGTIIDAFAAGVPVIAYNWEYAFEMIENGVTGEVIEMHNVDKLVQTLISAYYDIAIWIDRRTNCALEAVKYLPENAMSRFFEMIDSPRIK